MKRILILVLSILIILTAVVGYRQATEQSAKKVILSLGEILKGVERADVRNSFLDNSSFVHKESTIGYAEALKNAREKVRDGQIYGDIYVTEIHEITNSYAKIAFLGWVNVGDTDNEVSGYVYMVKLKWLTWKIEKIESDSNIFNEIFLK